MEFETIENPFLIKKKTQKYFHVFGSMCYILKDIEYWKPEVIREYLNIQIIIRPNEFTINAPKL